MIDWTVAGFQAASHIPMPIWRGIGAAGASYLANRPPKALRQWGLNAEVVTGRKQTKQDLKLAQQSWFRNTFGSLRLAKLSPERIVSTVAVDPEKAELLLELQRTKGLVIALPHQGSWDHAGAWACQIGLPVLAVAERLPKQQFAYFKKMRNTLGMEIYPHDAANLIATLCADVRQGKVICLVADRDFSRRGIEVNWPTPNGPRQLTAPIGPYLITEKTGAALIGAATWFEGEKMRLELTEEITGDMSQKAQTLTDFFATSIREHVHDWHLMQRFFPGVTA